MKYLLMLLLSLYFLGSSFAQLQNEFKVQSSKLKVDSYLSQSYNSQLSTLNSQLSKAYGDTIWYEDFDSTRWSTYGIGEGPVGWQFQDNTGNDYFWGWSNHGPRGRYTSPNGYHAENKEDLEPENKMLEILDKMGVSSYNGIMQIETDWFNTTDDNELADEIVTMNSYVQTKVDLSMHEQAQISYYQMYRHCCSGLVQLSLFVSTDFDIENPDLAHWVEYDSRGIYFTLDYTFEQDRMMKFDISEIAGGEPEVTLRWQVINSSHYFWMIDDIFITEPAANDLVMNRAWWDYAKPPYEGEGANRDEDWNGGYTKIPYGFKQDFVSFRAAVENFGYATQENVKLNVSIFNENQEVYNIASTGSSLQKGEKDTIKIISDFRPISHGNYMVSSTVISENIDEIPADNGFSYEFEITYSEYSRTYDPPYSNNVFTGAWVSGGNPGDALIVKYEIFKDVEIYSISTYFWDNDQPDQIADIEDGNFKMIGRLYKLDEENNEIPNTPIISTELHDMTMTDTMSWITMDFLADGESEFLDPGVYYAGIETYTSTVDIDFEIAEDLRILQPIDNSYAWFSGELGGINANPVININIEPSASKYSVYYELDVNGTDIDTTTDTIYISGDMFYPSWPEPGTFTECMMEYDDADQLFKLHLRLEPGEYEYNYYKNSGISGVEPGDVRTFEVDDMPVTLHDIWYTGIEENAGINYRVYPNPARDLITISNITNEVEIKLYDLIGKEHYISLIRNTGQVQIDIRSIPAGVYFLNINQQSQKIIISH